MFENYMHLEIEQSILGRFIEKPNDVYLYNNLKSEHFIFDDNKKIYNTILKFVSKNKPITPDLISRDNGVDIKYITGLINYETDVKIKVEFLIEESDKYNVLMQLKDVIEYADNEKDCDIYSKLSDLSLRKTEVNETVSNEKILLDLENKMNNGICGIKTSIESIDDSINSFQNGRLYIVGARPSMGKTAFMCSLIEQIEKEHKVGIVSLEMKTEELKQRIACLRGQIKHWKIEKGKCSANEFDDYANSLYSLKNIVYNDTGGMNRMQVVNVIKNFVKKSKCEIVFIDHLGLIKVNSGGNLAHEIGENTSTLKSLSKELNIPIVCLCQLNRSVEKEKQPMPKLSDLRDSGRIEEDADCVILLYRDNYYNNDCKGFAKYIIAKCRNGKTGYVDGFFDSEMMKWS